ncbi:hypothetical protein BH09GEM1_BH09GEM1_30200 [soil metagenome]
MYRVAHFLSRATGAATVALALSGCGGVPTDTGGAQSLFPLRVGTTWSYHSFDSTTGPGSDFGPAAPDSDFVLRVLKDTIDVTGRQWFAIENANRLFVWTQPGFFANASDGFRRLTTGPGLSGQQFVFTSSVITYPVPKGQPTVIGFVTALDTAITVGAGTFRCVRYDLRDSSDPGSMINASVFLAPRVGIVQRTVFKDGFSDGAGGFRAQRNRVYQLAAYQP